MRLCLLLVIASLAPAPAGAITLSTLRSDCRVLIRDTGSSRNRFSDAQLLRFFNEGQKEAVRTGKPIRKSYTFDLVSGSTYYSMPTDFLYPVRVTRDYFYLEERSVANLDKTQEWQTTGGLPLNYFVNFSSRTKMGFYPFPDATTSTGTIRMEYVATAVDMAADTDQPFNGVQELQVHANALTYYCAYRASLIDQQTALAQAYASEWASALSVMGDNALARPNYKPGAVPASTPGGGSGWSPGP